MSKQIKVFVLTETSYWKQSDMRFFLYGTLWDGTLMLCCRSGSGNTYDVEYNPDTHRYRCSCPSAAFRPLECCKHVAQAVRQLDSLLSQASSPYGANDMKQISPTVGNIGPVRFSYMHLFKPRLNSMREPPVTQYSATLLIPKEPHEHLPDPKAEIKGVADMINAAAVAKFGAGVKVYEKPFRDGDKEFKDDGEPRHPGYWFLKVSSGEEYPPKLIDGKRNEVRGGWESGDWGIVQVAFSAYNHNGKKGVGAYVRGIQFLFVDEHFGGGGASADDFDEVEGATTASGAQPKAADEYDPFDSDD